MDPRYLKRSFVTMAVYLTMTVLLGFCIFFLSLDRIECDIVMKLQNFTTNTVGIQLFQVFTYLGDFFLWGFFSVLFFFYAYFRSRQYLSISIKLLVYLFLITAFALLLKVSFMRARPHCTDIVVYVQESFYSYPSGHVSRGVGAIIILVGKRNAITTFLVIVAVFMLSLSRVVLGVHFPTDIFGAFFISLSMYKATEIIGCRFLKAL